MERKQIYFEDVEVGPSTGRLSKPLESNNCQKWSPIKCLNDWVLAPPSHLEISPVPRARHLNTTGIFSLFCPVS